MSTHIVHVPYCIALIFVINFCFTSLLILHVAEGRPDAAVLFSATPGTDPAAAAAATNTTGIVLTFLREIWHFISLRFLDSILLIVVSTI